MPETLLEQGRWNNAIMKITTSDWDSFVSVESVSVSPSSAPPARPAIACVSLYASRYRTCVIGDDCGPVRRVRGPHVRSMRIVVCKLVRSNKHNRGTTRHSKGSSGRPRHDSRASMRQRLSGTRKLSESSDGQPLSRLPRAFRVWHGARTHTRMLRCVIQNVRNANEASARTLRGRRRVRAASVPRPYKDAPPSASPVVYVCPLCRCDL
jgi:hypothetical protein